MGLFNQRDVLLFKLSLILSNSSFFVTFFLFNIELFLFWIIFFLFYPVVKAVVSFVIVSKLTTESIVLSFQLFYILTIAAACILFSFTFNSFLLDFHIFQFFKIACTSCIVIALVPLKISQSLILTFGMQLYTTFSTSPYSV